jgi:hypothetical protein
MLFSNITALTVALALLGMVQAGQDPPGQDPKPDDDKSRKVVEAWVTEIAKGESVPVLPKIAAVGDAVRKLFPDDRFYTVRYMRYPRAVIPPAPLKLDNVVFVRPNGTVERIESLEALQKLIEKKLADVCDAGQARVALLACLRLAQEFYQDGYYTFTIPEDSLSVVARDGGWVASGKDVVSKGGRGEIKVTLTTGTTPTVVIDGKVRPDVRPR